MTDPTLDTPPAGDTPGAGDQPDPTPPAKPITSRSSSSDADDRFAAYDTRLAKFVGGVHPTKTAATKAAKDRGVKAGDIDVRKV